MAVTQYIGARYVPLFAEPSEWDSTRAYEPLTIVIHQGNSYTSKQAVPIGIDITNNSFWALTGNYNAQVEAYRREVTTYSDRIDAAQDTANEALGNTAALETSLANETSAREAADTALQNTIETEVQGAIDQLSADLSSATTTLTNKINADVAAERNARIAADSANAELLADYKKWDLISRGELYGIVDRFIWNERHDGDFVNIDSETAFPSSQGGYFFRQGSTTYGAYPMQKGDSHYIVFRNIDNNSTVGYFSPQGYSHDEALAFNAAGNVMKYIGGETGKLYTYNISNLSSPSLSSSVDSGFTGTSAIPDMQDAGKYWSYTGFTLKHTNVGSAPTADDIVLRIKDFFDIPQGVLQSVTISQDGKYAVCASWKPNSVWIFDIEAQELKCVVNVKQWYDFVPFAEVESAQMLDGRVWITSHQALEGYAIPTTIMLDWLHPNVCNKQDFLDGQSVGMSAIRYVYGTTGKLFRKASEGTSNFQFMLISDAINAAKRAGDNTVVLYMRDSGYPRDYVVEGINVTFSFLSSLTNSYDLYGGIFNNCNVNFTNPQGMRIHATKDNGNIAWCMRFNNCHVLYRASNAANAKAFGIVNDTSIEAFHAFYNVFGTLDTIVVKGWYCDHAHIRTVQNTSTDTNFTMANCTYTQQNISGNGRE